MHVNVKCPIIVCRLQEDAFPACLTVQEIMEFWAALVLPSHDLNSQTAHSPALSGQAWRKQAVHEALLAMGLLGQRQTLVRFANEGARLLRARDRHT